MTRSELLEFLRKHRVGVVATTSQNGEPQSALVGIAVSDKVEIVFDTLAKTRKCQNLRRQPNTSMVIGWNQETTVQYEGIADAPVGAELERLKAVYFGVYPECMSHQAWEGITNFRLPPTWIRYSVFNSRLVSSSSWRVISHLGLKP
jgi:pyridoxine/pyridoxamine 5'-phosphate oxidase